MALSGQKRSRNEMENDDGKKDETSHSPQALKYRKLNNNANKYDIKNDMKENADLKSAPFETRCDGKILREMILDGICYIIEGTQAGIYPKIGWKSQLTHNLDPIYWDNIMAVINMNGILYGIDANSKLIDVKMELELTLICNDSILKLTKSCSDSFSIAILMDAKNENICCAVSNHSVSRSCLLYKDIKNAVHTFQDIYCYDKMITISLTVQHHNKDGSWTPNHTKYQLNEDCICLQGWRESNKFHGVIGAFLTKKWQIQNIAKIKSIYWPYLSIKDNYVWYYGLCSAFMDNMSEIVAVLAALANFINGTLIGMKARAPVPIYDVCLRCNQIQKIKVSNYPKITSLLIMDLENILASIGLSQINRQQKTINLRKNKDINWIRRVCDVLPQNNIYLNKNMNTISNEYEKLYF